MEIVITIVTYFFSLMNVVEEDIARNCSRKDFDLMLESMFIDTGNSLSADCINCNSVNMFRKYLSPELESEAVQLL